MFAGHASREDESGRIGSEETSVVLGKLERVASKDLGMWDARGFESLRISDASFAMQTTQHFEDSAWRETQIEQEKEKEQSSRIMSMSKVYMFEPCSIHESLTPFGARPLIPSTMPKSQTKERVAQAMPLLVS